MKFVRERLIRRVYDVSLILKAVDGVLECIGGIAIVFLSQGFFLKLATFVTLYELSEDPNDLIANAILHAAQTFSVNTKVFVSLYLLLHGITKIFLVIQLLRERLWAFPVGLAFLGLFILYQTERSVQTHAPGMLLLTLFDIFVVMLVWHEWRIARMRAV